MKVTRELDPNLLVVLGINYRIRHIDHDQAPEGRLYWIEDHVPLLGWERAIDVDFTTLEEALVSVLDFMGWRGSEVIRTRQSAQGYNFEDMAGEYQAFELIRRAEAMQGKAAFRKGAERFISKLRFDQMRIRQNVTTIATEWLIHFTSSKMSTFNVTV